MTQQPRRRYRALAAVLSFVFPGLGQAYAGNRYMAAVFALPVAVLILVTIGFLATAGHQLLNTFLSASFLTAVLVIDLVLMAWRLYAIAHVGFGRGAPQLTQEGDGAQGSRGRPRNLTAGSVAATGLVVLLLALTIGMHAWAGLVVGQLNATLADVFGGAGGSESGAPKPHGGANGGPLNEPSYSWDGSDRINFLLLGIDSAPGRGQEALTDTILVVSVDPVSKTAVMVSVPRDTGFVPLPDRTIYSDGLYPNKINALSTEAGNDPARWCPDLPPDANKRCGLRTLERSLSLYLGIQIQYYATIDLEGFTRLIDAVGPLRLCLDGKLEDPTYHIPGTTWRDTRRGVVLPAGCADDYDGVRALAYARARKGTLTLSDGTVEPLDDFMRSDRQQRVLLELRREFATFDLVFELPDALRAVSSTVATDFPRSQAGDLASLLPLITGPDIKRMVLGLPRFVDPPANPLTNYMLVPRRGQVRRAMQQVFGADQLRGWYLASNTAGPGA